MTNLLPVVPSHSSELTCDCKSLFLLCVRGTNAPGLHIKHSASHSPCLFWSTGVCFPSLQRICSFVWVFCQGQLCSDRVTGPQTRKNDSNWPWSKLVKGWLATSRCGRTVGRLKTMNTYFFFCGYWSMTLTHKWRRQIFTCSGSLNVWMLLGFQKSFETQILTLKFREYPDVWQHYFSSSLFIRTVWVEPLSNMISILNRRADKALIYC